VQLRASKDGPRKGRIDRSKKRDAMTKDAGTKRAHLGLTSDRRAWSHRHETPFCTPRVVMRFGVMIARHVGGVGLIVDLPAKTPCPRRDRPLRGACDD